MILTKTVDGVIVEYELTEEEELLHNKNILDGFKRNKISMINVNYNPLESVEVNGVVFNGGDGSAGAIAGAVQLAQALGETEAKLWDVNNTIATYAFEEAMTISAQIAKAYRDTQFAKYEKIAEINACVTIEELEAVEI